MQAGGRRPDARARTGDAGSAGSAGGIAERVAESVAGHYVLAATAAVHCRIAIVDTDPEDIAAADNCHGGAVPRGTRRPERYCRT